MPIKTSGQLTISDIVAEFGGTAPYDISDYYRGGGLVPNKNINSQIPLAGSGQPIKFGQFYGASKIIEMSYTLWAGGGAGGQGYEDGAGSGRANSGQDSVFMTRASYNSLLQQNGNSIPTTIAAAFALARSAGGLGGGHGAAQRLPGGDGGGTDFGAGGTGGAVNSAAPQSTWGRWGIGGGGGGGDQGNGSDWGFFGLIKYGSADSWGQSGDGGAAGEKVVGKIDLDVEVDYIFITGRAGSPGTGVGNHNGAYGVPGIIQFTLDTTPGIAYDITPAGDGSSIAHRLTTTVKGMRLDRTGAPVFFDV
jgi:hypothetical protein